MNSDTHENLRSLSKREADLVWRELWRRQLLAIERIYWFTIEYGLTLEGGKLRALGAGLASSVEELSRALDSRSVERQPLDLGIAQAQPFHTNRPQDLYFVSGPLADLAPRMQRFHWMDEGVATSSH